MISMEVILSALFLLNGITFFFTFLLFLKNNEMKGKLEDLSQGLRKVKGEVSHLSTSMVSMGQVLLHLEVQPLPSPLQQDNHYITNSEATILKILERSHNLTNFCV